MNGLKRCSTVLHWQRAARTALCTSNPSTTAYWCLLRGKQHHRLPLESSYSSHIHVHKIGCRGFASASNEPLANEKLVTALIRKAHGLPADELKVRVIVESRNTDTRPQPQLVTLAEAIKMSIALDNRDLIAVSLDQEVPVLRIDQLNSFLYKQSKRVAASSKKQTEKEFRFNAEIEENDLKRKVDSITDSLSKGTQCIVSIRCKNWMLKKDAFVVKNTTDRVIDSLNGVAELMNEVKILGDGTRAQFRLRAAK